MSRAFHRQGMPCGRRGGFTLLELMVVLLLIGIIAAMAGLAVGDGGRSDLLEHEARRLKALMQLAGEEAILRGREVAFGMDAGDYRFFVLEGDTWREMAKDPVFRRRGLPPGFHGRVFLDGREARPGPPGAADPQVVFYSSGELSPFELLLEAEPVESWYVLTGRIDGSLELNDRHADGPIPATRI